MNTKECTQTIPDCHHWRLDFKSFSLFYFRWILARQLLYTGVFVRTVLCINRPQNWGLLIEIDHHHYSIKGNNGQFRFFVITCSPTQALCATEISSMYLQWRGSESGRSDSSRSNFSNLQTNSQVFTSQSWVLIAKDRQIHEWKDSVIVYSSKRYMINERKKLYIYLRQIHALNTMLDAMWWYFWHGASLI